MEQILNYIANLFLGSGVVIAVGAYVMGLIIKQALDFIPNKYIPLICGVMGAVAGVTVPGMFPDADWFTAAVSGLALAWAATGGYETIRNVLQKKGEGTDA